MDGPQPHAVLARYYASRHVQERLAEYCGADLLGAPSLSALHLAGYGGLTAYADPLMSRHTRCAFSSNQKGAMTGAAPELPFVLTLPRGEGSYADLLPERRDPEAAAWLASWVSVRIPDVADAGAWLDEYRASGLGAFHTEFDARPGGLAGGPLRPDLRAQPACARPPLRFPNPLLLQPRHLRTVSLGLWSLGWHPRSIASLVQSRFEEDHGWGGLWERYDPAGRAAFYVRLFCGAAAEGLEDGAFDCGRQAEAGLCTDRACGYDLGASFARRRQRTGEGAVA